MPILKSRDRDPVKRRFDIELKKEVKLKLFTKLDTGLFVPGRECQTCKPAGQLIDEVSELSDKISLEVVDFYGSPSDSAALGIKRIPALMISANDCQGARYFGLPTGYEFTVLIESIIIAGRNNSPLQVDTRRRLKHMKGDAHIQVFVTPT